MRTRAVPEKYVHIIHDKYDHEPGQEAAFS